MLLLLATLMASSAAESMPTGSVSPVPTYYADRAGSPVVPARGKLDLDSDQSLTLPTPDGMLRIAYQDIRSLSYSPSAVSATQPGYTRYDRLLTIGFDAGNGVHHNLVVQLDTKSRDRVLKAIAAKTGLKIGDPPRK